MRTGPAPGASTAPNFHFLAHQSCVDFLRSVMGVVLFRRCKHCSGLRYLVNSALFLASPIFCFPSVTILFHCGICMCSALGLGLVSSGHESQCKWWTQSWAQGPVGGKWWSWNVSSISFTVNHFWLSLIQLQIPTDCPNFFFRLSDVLRKTAKAPLPSLVSPGSFIFPALDPFLFHGSSSWFALFSGFLGKDAWGVSTFQVLVCLRTSYSVLTFGGWLGWM